MNPFSGALMAYHCGDHAASFTIRRDDGFEEEVPASVFYTDQSFPEIELRGLELCGGSVLDIGAAAGRHTLELIRRGCTVTSLDILPEMESILRVRCANKIVISDVFSFSEQRFDTLLMLMNGIGMVGTFNRLDEFLLHAHKIITNDGQVVFDSIDVAATTDPVHVAYRQKNIELGKPPGRQSFTMTYKTLHQSYDWLHIDFSTLSEHCQKAGWEPTLIFEEPDGHYLCVLKNMIDSK
jgi:SAM-dependent methyltransferase